MEKPAAVVAYTIESGLGVEEFVDVLRRSGLDARRPVNEPQWIARMLEHADLVVTARDDSGRLIGVARSVTDFSYCCYVSDLAVDRAWQGRGIGCELLRLTHEKAGGTKNVTLLLVAAPEAAGYYPKVGMERIEDCFGHRRTG